MASSDPARDLAIAHRAVMVNDAAQTLKDHRRKVAAHGPNGTTEPESPEMIHIGDIINQPPPPSALTPESKPQSLLSRLAPVLAGGALTATGLGAGLGIPMLFSGLSKTSNAPLPPVAPIVKEWESSAEKMIITPPQ